MPHGIHQQLQRLRVAEHSGEASAPCFLFEGVRRDFADQRGEQFAGGLTAQLIKQQHDDLRIGQDVCQASTVDRAEPVRLPARDTKPRASELFQPVANLAERSQGVDRSRSHLVEAVDEERPVLPLGVGVQVQFDKVAGCHVFGGATQRLALPAELGGLARAGVAQQHVCVCRLVRAERLSLARDEVTAILRGEFGAGTRNWEAHGESIQ